jgi:hypothetical protein
LGAHRICIRQIFDPAEAGMFDWESNSGIADYLSGDADTVDFADTIQEKG